MSDDYEDDWWDDPEPIIETVIREIKINNVRASDVRTFEKGLITCIEQKLEKLNIITKNMNVCAIKDHLVINDRYSICPEFSRIVENFGMNIKAVSVSGLKGKTYLISDEIVAILHKLSSCYQFGKSISNMKSNEAIENTVGTEGIQYKNIDLKYDRELVSYISEILDNGSVTVQGTETLIDGISQGIVSNSESVKSKLNNLIGEIKSQVKNNNKNMQNGTTEILYHRARQMGYSVEKKTNGKEVQLVLVRLQ
jgi:hypothetical protein